MTYSDYSSMCYVLSVLLANVCIVVDVSSFVGLVFITLFGMLKIHIL